MPMIKTTKSSMNPITGMKSGIKSIGIIRYANANKKAKILITCFNIFLSPFFVDSTDYDRTYATATYYRPVTTILWQHATSCTTTS
jgi:hypothetical protein